MFFFKFVVFLTLRCHMVEGILLLLYSNWKVAEILEPPVTLHGVMIHDYKTTV
jgi:hypothetical protein